MSMVCGIAQILSSHIRGVMIPALKESLASPITSVMSSTCPALIMSSVGPLPYSNTSGTELVSKAAPTSFSKSPGFHFTVTDAWSYAAAYRLTASSTPASPLLVVPLRQAGLRSARSRGPKPTIRWRDDRCWRRRRPGRRGGRQGAAQGESGPSG